MLEVGMRSFSPNRAHTPKAYCSMNFRTLSMTIMALKLENDNDRTNILPKVFNKNISITFEVIIKLYYLILHQYIKSKSNEKI